MRFQMADTISCWLAGAFTRKTERSSDPDKHWYLHRMRPIFHQSGVFSDLNLFVWAKICPHPYEDCSNACSASLDVCMGRSFSNVKPNSSSASTNRSKSSSVCCRLLLQSCQALKHHSFYMPKLLATGCLLAEICGLLDVKRKYVL